MADEPLRAKTELAQRNLEFMRDIPFHQRTGIQIVKVDRGRALMKLPYSPELVGNPDTGVLHGGIVTALLDACSGLAVFMNIDKLMAIATLELRIDYLRPATQGKEILAEAECYRMTPHVAFARAQAYHPDDREKLIATCSGTFMLGTKPGKRAAGPEAT